MAKIRMITEWESGRKVFDTDTHFTVYYESGRKVNYYGNDTMPIPVVEFLTSDKTVSETTYINDSFNKCINKRTKYIQE